MHRFEWLLGTFGPHTFFDDTNLILPSGRFFQTHGLGDKGRVGRLFDEVRAHMGIAHWPVRLVPRGAVPMGRDPAAYLRTAVAGSFYDPPDAGPAIITYNPRLTANRTALIGTFAHELAHYILAPHAAQAPGGEPEHELLTDLAVVFFGFGVIDLQGAHEIGWRGYLDSGARLYALATFLRLKGIDPSATHPHLDRSLQRRLLKALIQRDDRGDEIAFLKAFHADQVAAVRPG
ncbi:MAG: hypothetical protein AAGE76_16505 [Pseudomonadota bacterium]